MLTNDRFVPLRSYHVSYRRRQAFLRVADVKCINHVIAIIILKDQTPVKISHFIKCITVRDTVDENSHVVKQLPEETPSK